MMLAASRSLSLIGPNPTGRGCLLLNVNLPRVSLRIRLLSRSQKDDDQQVQSGYSIRQGLCDDPAVFLRPAIKVSWRFMRPEDATKKEFQKAVVVPVSFSEFAEVIPLSSRFSLFRSAKFWRYAANISAPPSFQGSSLGSCYNDRKGQVTL